MALSNLTKVQTVGIGSNIEVVGVVTTGQFKSGTSNLHSSGVELTNLNVSGIATIGGNLSIGGTLTYQDVTNIDSVGLITARAGVNVSGGQLDVGSNIKIGTAGVVTATSFVGSGANLTSLPAQVTIANNANNRIITGGSGVNLNGEAGLTYDGNDLTITGAIPSLKFTESDGNPDYQLLSNNGIFKIHDVTNSADRFAVNTNGTGYFLSNFQIGSTTTSPGATLHIKTSYPSLKVDSGGHASDAYVRIISGNAQNSRVDFGDSDDDNIGIIDYDHANNSMSFTTNTTERLRIDSSGRVLIGTTTEGSGGADELTIATSGDTGMTIRSGTSSAGGIYFSDGTSGGDEYRGVLSYNHANNYMRFYTDGTEKMRLDTNGSLRILDFSTAVDSGADDLVVGTTNSGINRGMTILSHTGADARICFATASDPDEGMIKYSHGSDVMQFFVNAAERMRIENLGDSEWGMKFLNSKAIEFKDQGINICSLTWSISASTWTNFFSHQTYFQGWVFLNGTHNAGNSSALWSISKSPSGGSTANRFAHDNSYSPASINMRVNGLWTQINSSYATYGYAVLISLAGGNNVANLSG